MSEGIDQDPLFVGLTRPPMLFGASYTFTLLNGMSCMMAYVITTSFKYLALMFPIHMVGYYICSKEPLFIELLRVKAQKCSVCRNRFYHGANSYDQY
ncbi:type IV secretion system protein VirB3 [Rickettsiales endosymbiont of Peranema trichophorum]|uniref:VirB3 family type IV secretion system protein n=1 Tax=Rickettsiales endosymbiont of Peranema trichophorum TaxID=2486577 RepID=UPI001023E777|nr:VirB3 family type IV secretion system protein [Rickettsiales endosymbiont of Peranema trichophorum]RZI46019.1 type IV secretion system protein VirB3 [Rickettsiales endosymbiont of Peranema trichophorum]